MTAGIVTIDSISMSGSMQAAVRAGLKTATARPVESSNTRMSRGRFDQIRDLRAEAIPQSSISDALKVHQLINGHRTLCTLRAKIEPHRLLWMRRKDGTGRNEGPSLYVEQVNVLRLQELGTFQFARLGLRWYSDSPAAEFTAQNWIRICERILSVEGGRDAIAIKRDLPVLPTPRDAYAALWDTMYGAGAWRSNPWIWLYQFKAVRHNADTALRLARDGLLHYELRS